MSGDRTQGPGRETMNKKREEAIRAMRKTKEKELCKQWGVQTGLCDLIKRSFVGDRTQGPKRLNINNKNEEAIRDIKLTKTNRNMILNEAVDSMSSRVRVDPVD